MKKKSKGSARGSSAEIERLYDLEKKKIESSRLKLEKERLKAYLRMTFKKAKELGEKISDLKREEKSYARPLNEVSRQRQKVLSQLKALDRKKGKK